MTSQWGYLDPVQRAHEQRAEWVAVHPPCPAVQAPQPVVNPLAGLDQAVPQIVVAAGYPRHENVAERMLIGGLIGALLGAMFARRKAQRLQERKDSLDITDAK